MNSNLGVKNIFYILLVTVLLWFLYSQRQILAPFIIAMIFAFVFNPLINLFSKYLKMPRITSILLVYIILIGSVGFGISILTDSIVKEFESLTKAFSSFVMSAKDNTSNLPIWIKPYAIAYFEDLNKNEVIQKISISSIPFFSVALSGIVNVLIFLFATFFFLKDNKKMISRSIQFLPVGYQKNAKELLVWINSILSSYLRGQLILVVSLIFMLSIGFHILGVKYALSLAVLSGILGIIPFIGTLFSIVFGAVVTVMTGGIHNFQLGTLETVIVFIATFYAAQLIQDYVIAPFVIGRVTKLHPLVILFSVIVGGQIYGILGILLAVPIVAVLKIILEFSSEKINNKT